MKNILAEINSSFTDAIADYVIVLLDTDYRVTSWNKGAEQILGYSAEEALGENFRMFFTPKDIAERVPERILEKIKIDGTATYEGWRVKKNGDLFWGEVLFTALFDEDNVLAGYSVIARDTTDKKKEREFEQSNMLALINNTHDLMWSVDRDYKLITANMSFDKLVLQLSGGIIEKGASVLSIGFTEAQLERFKARYDRAFAGETFTEIEYASQPYEFWNEISFYPITDGSEIVGTACHSHNITKRIIAKRKIMQLNRLYAFISQINHAIVHAKNEETLFKETCKVAIKIGNFKVAWLGKIDKENKTVSLIEQCGLKDEHLPLFSKASYENNGPTEIMLRTSNPYVCNDVPAEFTLEGWKAFALDNGFQSCMVLPLVVSGEITGTFNLYAEETGYFDEEEIALLQKAAEDISFALEVFEKEKLRAIIEEKLKYSELRLKQSQEIAHFGSWELNFATGNVVWSDEACRIFGLSPDENKQSYASWISFIHPDDLKYVMKVTKDAEKTLSNASFYHRIITRDGVIRNIHSRAHFEFNKEGEPVGLFGVANDVTEEIANITRLKLQNEQLEDIAFIQSHKVRGPLATILGLAQALEESSSDEETKMIVRGILTTSEKLDTIIHEIVGKTAASEILNSIDTDIDVMLV